MMLPLLLATATALLSPQLAPLPPAPPAPVVPAVPAAPPAPAAPAVPLAIAPPQTPSTLPTPPAPPVPAVPQTPPTLRTPTPPPPPAKPGQNVNVRIELTITESGNGEPETKLVSLIASDANWGRVRSTGAARPNAATEFGSVVLNVDARPTLLSGDAMRLELTVEYVPPVAEATTTADIHRPARLHQSLNVIVKNGQSLQVSRAVDPVSKRTTTVDVKATPLP